MNKSRPKSVSFGDVLALLCAAAMIIGFVFFSWFSGVGDNPNGISLLSAPPDQIKMISSPGLVLVIAILGGILTGVIGVTRPRFNRWTAIGAFGAGLIALAYFGYFIYRMDTKSPDAEQYLGPGFWITLIASFGLLVQILIPRSMGGSILPNLDNMSAALGRGLGIIGFLRKPRRIFTHIILALLTVAACYLVILLKSTNYQAEQARDPANLYRIVITDGTDYLSLVLIAVSLIIGPIKLLTQKHIPVNVDLRRDTGIWAGITGILHVIFGLQVHMSGQLWMYFFRNFNGVYKPDINLFGLTNWIGAVATVILVLLLVLSNDVTLRMLKGPLWKLLQRLNYFLVVLVVIHALLYQQAISREGIMRVAVIVLSLLILLAQAFGFYLWRANRPGLKAKSVAGST